MAHPIETLPRGFSALVRRLGRIFSYAQGQGFGVATIGREVRLVHSVLRTPPLLAIDIGGNIGDYTAELRRRSPGLDIHLFEPSSTNIAKLSARFAGDDRIVLVPRAISNKTGTAILYSNEPGSGLGSLSQRQLDHLDIPFDFTETIDTQRFDEYWKGKLNGRDIDIMKIDIEGHELAALEGAGDAIAAVKAIQFEFGGCNIDTRTYLRDFWHFFKDSGFALYRITPFGLQNIERYRESDECFSTTNYIAVNSRHL